MKTNLPVTDVEYTLKEHDSIVSKSDLKGLITYVNEGFIRISGFSRDELIGAPHNIVRHPDMPAEVFADLWHALQAGRPWTGMIKNRSKSGGYYWASTNMTPFYENDQLVGYMAVRSMPSREQIMAASSAYQLFQDNQAGNLKIQDGKIIKTSLFQKLSLFKNLSIKARLIVVISLLSILMVIIGSMGLDGMSKTNEGLHKVYKSHTVAMNQIFKISELQRDNLVLIASSLVTPTPEVVQQNTLEMEENIAEITRLWNAYLQTDLTPEEKGLADHFSKANIRLVQQGLKAATAALAANDIPLVNKIRIEQIRPYYRLANEGIIKLMQLQIDVAKKEYEFAQTRYENTRNNIIALKLMGITLAIWLGFSLIRAIVRPLDSAIHHFGHIAQGNYKTLIEIESMNEIGKVMAALKSMQIKQGFDVAETKRVADEHMPVRIALDNVSTGLMIANNERKIIYVNKAVTTILGNAEADIIKQLPNFSVANLVGTSIDRFHKNPAYQAEYIATMHTTQIVNLEIGGHSLVLTLNPVFNEQGYRLGTVAEWKDRTAELVMEKEIDAIVHEAAQGNFTRRIKIQDKQGFLKQLGEGLNNLLENTERGINDVERALGALSHSDLSETITNDYSGSLDKLKNDTNTTVLKLKDAIAYIKTTIGHFDVDASAITTHTDDLVTPPKSSDEPLTSCVLLPDLLIGQHADQLAVKACASSEQGAALVMQLASTLQQINVSTGNAKKVIAVLNDIALQTNMLSLIATVEVTRAGEHGQGFSAVAAEVKNLAERVANATTEINTLIDESFTTIGDGASIVTQTGVTLEEIINALSEMRVMLSDLSKISSSQMACIRQINQAIGQWTF